MGLSEKQLEHSRKYYAKPEVKVKRKIYNSDPTVKERLRLSQKKWALKNKHIIEDKRILRKYGISLDDYNNLFEKQNGCCTICQTHQMDLKKKLVIDHNHESGKVRGLLCAPCNMALGLLKDNSTTLLKASNYVAEYEWD